jgi:polysaccharide pyruvyl transferase WcaK-like protein
MMTKIAAYSGWLGNNNIGDEALYLANEMIFTDFELVNRDYYDDSPVQLYGGGTVLPRGVHNHGSDELVAAIGVGVEDPNFRNQPFAPVDIEYYLEENDMAFLIGNKYTQHIANQIASLSDSVAMNRKYVTEDRYTPIHRFDYLGVRGPRSKEILSRYGIDSRVVGDTALLLEPSEYNHQQSNRVAVTLRSAKGVLKWSDDTEYIQIVEKFCREHSDEYEFVFLPFRPIDIPLHVKLSKKIPNAEFKDYCSHVDVRAAVDEISDCDVIIGERLHASILAACSFTPFVSLGYQPKNDDFVESIDMTEYHTRFHQLTVNWLVDRFERIRASDDAHQKLQAEVADKRAEIQSLAGEITTAINERDY